MIDKFINTLANHYDGIVEFYGQDLLLQICTYMPIISDRDKIIFGTGSIETKTYQTLISKLGCENTTISGKHEQIKVLSSLISHCEQLLYSFAEYYMDEYLYALYEMLDYNLLFSRAATLRNKEKDIKKIISVAADPAIRDFLYSLHIHKQNFPDNLKSAITYIDILIAEDKQAIQKGISFIQTHRKGFDPKPFSHKAALNYPILLNTVRTLYSLLSALDAVVTSENLILKITKTNIELTDQGIDISILTNFDLLNMTERSNEIMEEKFNDEIDIIIKKCFGATNIEIDHLINAINALDKNYILSDLEGLNLFVQKACHISKDYAGLLINYLIFENEYQRNSGLKKKHIMRNPILPFHSSVYYVTTHLLVTSLLFLKEDVLIAETTDHYANKEFRK